MLRPFAHTTAVPRIVPAPPLRLPTGAYLDLSPARYRHHWIATVSNSGALAECRHCTALVYPIGGPGPCPGSTCGYWARSLARRGR
jgi:hypothetical protein